jgi:flagellar capping protein FliD
VHDSTDPDEILQLLQENTTLQDALENNAEDVLALFANPIRSTTELTGNIDISYGISLAAPLSFSVGNGTTQATVTFGVGYHSPTDILNEIMNALSDVGLGDAYGVYMTDGGFLQITAESDTGRARLVMQDLNAGASLANTLGIAPQTALGDDAYLNAGLGERLDAFLDGYVGTSGVIAEKIKLGGLIDDELLRISDRIDDYEYRLSLYEARLKTQFAAMEVALATFQQTSSFIESYTGVASQLSSSSSSSSSSIPISL